MRMELRNSVPGGLTAARFYFSTFPLRCQREKSHFHDKLFDRASSASCLVTPSPPHPTPSTLRLAPPIALVPGANDPARCGSTCL